MEEEEVLYLKAFDEKRGDVVFEGKVSTDVTPRELVRLGCFWNKGLTELSSKASEQRVKSFKGLQKHLELVARFCDDFEMFSGVLYVGLNDGVVRRSESVPSCECGTMSVWYLTHEECEKVFKCEALEELEISWCGLNFLPKDVGKMKELRKLKLAGLEDLKSIPEEFGGLSNLKELRIAWSRIERLPKGLRELKMLKSIHLVYLSDMQMREEDLVVFSKLKQLTINWCDKMFTQSSEMHFWEMIKSTTYLCFLDLDWERFNQEMLVAALEENGSIVDGGEGSGTLSDYFKRNQENHERARECVVHLLAIRRFGGGLSSVPKEMVKMLALMLWNTRCDVKGW